MYKITNKPSLTYYTYALINPTTNKPFYIGKGTNNRYLDHFKEAILCKTHNKYKTNTIKKILKHGHDVLIKILFESENEKCCFDEEIRLIKLYGRKNNKTGILTNLTDGGEGGSWKHSEEHKQKLRENNPGGKATSKPIFQISVNGDVLKKWESTRQAGVSLKINCWRNISNSANRHKNQLVGGFYWRWINDESVINNKLSNIEELNKNRLRGKRVKQMTLSGETIKIWESLTAASKVFKTSVSNLSNAVSNNRPHVGFLWRF